MAGTTLKTIDEYISTFPDEVQGKLQTVRDLIHKEVPGAEETISYGIPTFNLNGMYLIYFAGWKNHISLYPIPSSTDKAFQEELSLYLSGKGTVKFLLKNPIPFGLVKKIVKYRLREHQANKK